MWKKIGKLTLKCLIALLPIYIILGLYIYLDPFRVVHPSDPYFQPENPMHVGWNKGFVSTETFKNHHAEEHYDSYIFGSSLSIGYKAAEWSKYIGNTARIFHFDGSSDSFTGIIEKFRFINKCGEQVKNALFVVDPELFTREDNTETHLFAQHPDITPQWDFIQFHWLFFKLFMNREFLTGYIDMQINGLTPEMVAVGMFTKEFPDYNVKYNEENYPFYDNALAADEDKFYADRTKMFERECNKEYVLPELFTDETVENLQSLKDLLEKNGTDFRIIIHPMYHLRTLCCRDRAILFDIFGENRVFDFSGENKYTMNKRNYYDNNSHPRPQLCAELMRIVYKESADSINSLKSR